MDGEGATRDRVASNPLDMFQIERNTRRHEEGSKHGVPILTETYER